MTVVKMEPSKLHLICDPYAYMHECVSLSVYMTYIICLYVYVVMLASYTTTMAQQLKSIHIIVLFKT